MSAEGGVKQGGRNEIGRLNPSAGFVVEFIRTVPTHALVRLVDPVQWCCHGKWVLPHRQHPSDHPPVFLSSLRGVGRWPR